MAAFEATIVNATDVTLHCELPSTPPEELETNIGQLFQARMANNPSHPPEGGEAPALELSVGVSIPSGSPTLRVVDFVVKLRRIESHIQLTYVPNPEKTKFLAAKTGRLVPSDFPDGLLRISKPSVTHAWAEQ